MKRENLMARLLRAVSGLSQEQLAKKTGIHFTHVSQIETGKVVPSRDHLERMAKAAALTGSATEEILRLVDTLRQPRQRRGAGAEPLLDGVAQGVRSEMDAAYRRLLTLRLPEAVPQAEDRQRAAELFERLEGLPQEACLAIVQVAEECWSWALCERVCETSVREASRDVERASAWAHLARQIAERVQGPEEWRHRIQGYAAAHVANAMRVAGNLVSAEATLEQAKRLWRAGSDPDGLLDPGRLLDLEASLRRDQRRLPEALALLDEAVAVGRSPERVLLKKGYTLEVMGEYEQAVETLLRAAPRVLQRGDRRLESILAGNLALNYCHLGRFAEAALLADRVRAAAAETGDEIEALRMIWIQGRIAAGLGQSVEALSLLAQARQGFAARGMGFDAALALLEEAALLLDEGRTAEVKALAGELAVVFGSKGVHREALAALRLFQEAAEQESATANLARRVLGFLFRARHDPGLRFSS
jgi:transcriptional regulator with XRE-family HTH domain